VPTNMVSGPLAEWLGFSTFFVVVMFASVPSVWAAFKAPFPHRAETEGGAAAGDQPLTTADDPARLDPAQRAVQLLAGRASLFAMLNILTILLVDAKILGTLQGHAVGSGMTQFGFLIGSGVAKLFFAWRTFQLAGEAAAAARSTGEQVYLGNARGAKAATWVCAAVSLAVLAFGARMAF